MTRRYTKHLQYDLKTLMLSSLLVLFALLTAGCNGNGNGGAAQSQAHETNMAPTRKAQGAAPSKVARSGEPAPGPSMASRRKRPLLHGLAVVLLVGWLAFLAAMAFR